MATQPQSKMEDRIIIYPAEVHQDTGKAKLGVAAAAKELGVKCDCRLSSMLIIWVAKSDKTTFLELAKEMANV